MDEVVLVMIFMDLYWVHDIGYYIGIIILVFYSVSYWYFIGFRTVLYCSRLWLILEKMGRYP